MKQIYEVCIGMNPTVDYDTKEEAIAAVEAAGSGRLVKFVRDFDGRDRSVYMETYSEGKWTEHYIHG